MNCLANKYNIIAEIVKKENLMLVNSNSKTVVVRTTFYTRFIKRFIDIILSSCAIIITFPINVVLCIITIFDVGFPVIFKQERTGKNGKLFDIIKFRNMSNKRDDNGVLLHPSLRVTKIGSFIRKYSLDELLNFWSIFKGDMSIIGPRPLPHTFYERFSERHKMRYAVKPGLECPSINHTQKVRLYQQQLEDDIWYVENASFIVDCKLVLNLVRMVFNAKERADHANVSGGEFIGYDETGMAFSNRKIPDTYEKKYVNYVNNNTCCIMENLGTARQA